VYPQVTQLETRRLEIERELQLMRDLSPTGTGQRAVIRVVLPALTRLSRRRLAASS